MKLPLTDQFLLGLYDFIVTVDKTSELFIPPRTMREVLYPNFLKLKREYERRKARRRFAQFVNYLKKKGYIEVKNLRENQGVLITKKGIEKVINVKSKLLKKRRRLDGKWEMIIFDIPEKKRYFRNLLREKLHLLGYKMLQQSVWISPYDVFKETEMFLRKYSLDRYVRLFLIGQIE